MRSNEGALLMGLCVRLRFPSSPWRMPSQARCCRGGTWQGDPKDEVRDQSSLSLQSDGVFSLLRQWLGPSLYLAAQRSAGLPARDHSCSVAAHFTVPLSSYRTGWLFLCTLHDL